MKKGVAMGYQGGIRCPAHCHAPWGFQTGVRACLSHKIRRFLPKFVVCFGSLLVGVAFEKRAWLGVRKGGENAPPPATPSRSWMGQIQVDLMHEKSPFWSKFGSRLWASRWAWPSDKGVAREGGGGEAGPAPWHAHLGRKTSIPARFRTRNHSKNHRFSKSSVGHRSGRGQF